MPIIKLQPKGLTVSFIFEASSANYGETLGNVNPLKKISRGNNEQYSYVSRQAIRFNITEQMGINTTLIKPHKTVLQFHPDATIEESAEIDLFGYMKTGGDTKLSRSAVVRLSHAIALESYNMDLDFLTNKGLFDRYNSVALEPLIGGNIAQFEIHKAFYAYTIAIDLECVGIDGELEIPLEERANRIITLLKTLKFLYRDIKGRRENLSPVFIIGGVYNLKSPFFENRLNLEKLNLSVETIQDALALDEEIEKKTKIGLVKGVFANDEKIREQLQPAMISEVFKHLENEVRNYFMEV